MECERRKVYVEVNVTHRPDGTARPNSIKFENDEIFSIERDGFNLNKISMGTHTGSHIDAPLHFIKNGMSVSEIDDKYFFYKHISGRCIKI